MTGELSSVLLVEPLGFHNLCDIKFLNNDHLKKRWLHCSQNSLPFDAELTSVANDLVAEQLWRFPRFVLEGYPKRLGEVEHFLGIVRTVDCLILLDPAESTLRSRWAWRVQCPECKRTFSRQDTIECPSCGKRGEPKSDDAVDTFEKKLTDYRRYSQEIIPSLIQNSLTNLNFREEGIADIVTTVLQICEQRGFL